MTATLIARIVAAMLAIAGLAASAHAGMVRGTVMLGPTCPGPPRQGHECADKPIETTIDVFRSSVYPTTADNPYKRVQSDKQGRFQISLEPDVYWFVGRAPAQRAGISFPKPVEVVVTAGTTTVTLTVDTGMR